MDINMHMKSIVHSCTQHTAFRANFISFVIGRGGMAKKDVLLGGGLAKRDKLGQGGEGVKKSGFRWAVLSGWPLN